MKTKFKNYLFILLAMMFTLFIAGCDMLEALPGDSNNLEITISKEGSYDDFESVAAYIHVYGELPSNFISKREAKKLGWEPGKDLWDYAEGKSIGGDVFGNYEGSLPEANGRKWYECDINYKGGKRGADRIVFSNDGLIYGTSDHYETFTLYYGEEE